MADHSKIEWTDATWNPITGCSIESAGCAHCYAMLLAGTRLRHHPSRAGLTREVNGHHVWTGEVRFNDGTLGLSDWVRQPLDWARPRMLFVNAHGDTFHEGVPPLWIDKIFAVALLAQRHVFQVLTKRADRMADYLLDRNVRGRVFAMAEFLAATYGKPRPNPETAWPLQNVWAGVSAEDQRSWSVRVPQLVSTPAAVRWVSAEPLLGPIVEKTLLPQLDWIVVGGESGPNARPMHPDWARSLRDQCAAAGVPFLFKQWGEWLPWQPDQLPYFRSQAGELIDRHGLPDFNGAGKKGWTDIRLYDGDEIALHQRVGKTLAGRLLDGIQHNGYPA